MQHREVIDEAIAAWTSARRPDEVVAGIEAAHVPVGPIYGAADILVDPHYAARDMLVRHEVELAPDDRRQVAFPGVVPKLDRHPGSTRGVGPDLGAHTDEVLEELLDLDPAQRQALRDAGAI